MAEFTFLHDRHEGTWTGFEKRFSQDISDYAGNVVQSGYIELEDNTSYLFAWRENVVSATGAGLIRLNIYDSSYTQIPGYESIDLPLSETATSGWVRNIVRLRHYKDAVLSASDYMLPSGAAYLQTQILVPNTAPTGVEIYVNGLDLLKGTYYNNYTTSSGEVTVVEYNNLNNGYVNFDDLLLRDSYEHIGSRRWNATDATTGPDSYLVFEDTDAVNNTEYSYVIDAYDLNGNKSPLSEKKTIMAGDIYPPSQVSGLTITPGPEIANFTWICPADSDYSHANIYSDISLTTLVRSEVGLPGQNDTSLIAGLTPGVSYSFWVTAVDKYGNENTVSPPSGTVVPDEFSETSPLEIVFDGDDYVKQETQTFKVVSRIDMSGLPATTSWDVNNNSVTTSTLTLLTSFSGYYVWSGNLTVAGGNVDGQARIIATGITSTGTVAQSENKLFIIDKIAPSVTATLTGYNYSSGAKVFYNATTTPRYRVSVTDSGGVSIYGHRVDGSSSDYYIYNPYQSGVNNSSDVVFNSDGQHLVYVKAFDKAGNSTEVTITGYLDTKPPIVSISGISGSSQFLPWYNSTTMQVKFLARENEDAGATNVAGISGVNWRYSYNHAPTTESWNFATGQDPTVTIPTAGTIPTSTASVYIQYYGVDNAGNQSAYITDIINIDNKAPYFTAGLWGNCYPVPGGFHLIWNPSSIVDDAPSSGPKSIALYRSDNIALTSPKQIAVIPYDTAVRSFVDLSSDMEYYRTYWWYMTVTDNAGNTSSGSPSVSGTIDHNIKGIFRNLIGNGSFERVQNYDSNLPVGWTKIGSPTIQVGSGSHGIRYAAVTNTNYYYVENFPLINAKINKRQVLSFKAKKLNSSSNAGIGVTMKFYDANKTLISTSGTQTISVTTANVPYTSWGSFAIPIGNPPATSGIFPPNNGASVTALSCDIIISGTHSTDNLFLDSVQLEEPSSNTTVTGTDYVDSYNITGDILQGQRIIGNQIEANTINAEHLTIGVYGGNYIDNSSFEKTKSSTSLAAGWYHSISDSSIVSTSPHTGKYCAKIGPTVGAAVAMYGALAGIPAIANPLPVSGNNYVFSFYARVDGGTSNILVGFGFRDASYTLLAPSTQSLSISNTQWTRYDFTIGTGLDITPPAGATCCAVYFAIQSAGAACYIDSLQYELGTTPTIYGGGGSTQIDGGSIKTGIIQSYDTNTYFDLDYSRLRTFTTGGDYSEVTAGAVKTYDAATTKQTTIESGSVTNLNVTTGDFSRLTEGYLLFHNATAGTTTNYGNQIVYIEPGRINCGSTFTFDMPYAVTAPPPYVIMMPNRFKCFATSLSANDQYIGFDAEPITRTSFLPRAFLYAGTPTTTSVSGTSLTNRFTSLAADEVNYTAGDALDSGHGGSVNTVNVTIRTRNTDATSHVITNTINIRVFSGTPLGAATLNTNQVVAINTLKYDSNWVYSTIQFTGLALTNKYITCDWYSKSNSDNSDVELYKVDYINTPTTSGLTGYGIAGALIIGRTT